MTDEALRQRLAQAISDHFGQQLKLGRVIQGEDIFPSYVVLFQDYVVVVQDRFDSLQVTAEGRFSDAKDVEVQEHYSGWTFSARIGGQTIRVEQLDKKSAELLANSVSQKRGEIHETDDRSRKPGAPWSTGVQPEQIHTCAPTAGDYQPPATATNEKKGPAVAVVLVIVLSFLGVVGAKLLSERTNVCEDALEKYVDCLETFCQVDPSSPLCGGIEELRDMDVSECDDFIREESEAVLEMTCDQLVGH